ncbi:MAG TPA: invasin domain 3-containing protein [Puia sp.]
MKPVILFFSHLPVASGRRRNLVSALAGMLLLMLGFSTNSLAAGTPDRAAWDTYQVTIIPQSNNAIAGSGANDVVRVMVTDLTTGLPAVGFPLSFTISGTSVSSTPVTNALGYYDYGLASSSVGSADIIILANGQTTTFTFTYIAGPPATNPPPGSPNPSYFIVTKDNATADGSAQDIVEVHLSNQYGVNEPVGTLVTLTVTTSTQVPTDALLNGTTTTTVTVPLGPNGLVDIPITDVTVGSVTLQATYPSDPTPIGGPGYTQTVHFITGVPDPSKSYILVTQDPAVADGAAQDIVTAYLFDAQGRPTSGTVTFSIQSGTATFVTTVTGAGTVAAEYVSNTVGAVQVQAALASGTFLKDQNNPANNYATIHFTAGPPDPSKSYILVTQDPAPADGATQDIVTAYFFDAQGRATSGTVTFSIQSGTATLVTTVTGAFTAAAEYVSNTVGAVQVQAALLPGGTYLNDQSNPGNNYATIHFVVGPPDPSKSYIVVTQDNALADGSTQNIVTVYLFDAQGRAIKDGTNVTFSIKSGTATIVNSASQPVTTGSVSAQYVSNVVGAVQVQASYVLNGNTIYLTDQNNSANNYVTMHFVAGPPVPGNPGGGGSGGGNPGGGGQPPAGGGGSGGGSGGSNLKYTVLFVRQDFRLADGKQQDSVIAYVTDGSQHPLKNVKIKFFIQNTPTSGTATAGAQFVGDPTNVLTDDSGMARIAITSTMPGTVYVDAILVVNNVLIDGSYQVVTFVNMPDVTNPETKLIVIVYEALANGLGNTVVKAHVVDQNGLPLPGQDVTFTIDSGNATIVTPQPVTTDINGDATIQITSKTPGFVLITATVGGKSITFGSPARVKFAPINIYVPPVFTPNGDGVNDVLKPILVGIAEFHYFSVYNRWGNLIFTSVDPGMGWDGRFKGVAQPVETYLWIAEGIDTQGNKIVQRGMTTLVR